MLSTRPITVCVHVCEVVHKAEVAVKSSELPSTELPYSAHPRKQCLLEPNGPLVDLCMQLCRCLSCTSCLYLLYTYKDRNNNHVCDSK